MLDFKQTGHSRSCWEEALGFCCGTGCRDKEMSTGLSLGVLRVEGWG